MKRALGRLVLASFFAALAFGAHDAFVHGPELRSFERLEIVGLYALFAVIAMAAALPIAVLALALLQPFLGWNRAAVTLLWLTLVAALVAAAQVQALGLRAAIGGAALVTLWCASALRREAFASERPWRLASLFALFVAIGLAVTPPLLRGRSLPPRGSRVERERGRPDLVLIVLDTLRADFLGAYGRADGLTPTFDAFAQEGALFTGCFSSAPWTVPSHASLFTALQPVSHGCSLEHHRWLDRKFTTLAEALAERAGYQTAAFAANEWLFRANLLQGFEQAQPLGQRFAELAIRPLLELLGWPARYCDHGAADGVAAIDDFLARRRDAEKPLFLFVNLLETHWRDLPPLSERLDETRPEPGVVAATNVSRQFYGPLVMAGKRIAGPVDASIRSLYAAAVKYQDRKLGDLLTVLAARLDLDRAVVVVTADHGENLGEGGRYDHVFALNDALLHVPLAIRAPATWKPGTRLDGLCQLVDLPVTLFALAHPQGDAPLAEGVAGRSLLPDHWTPRDHVVSFGDPYLGQLGQMELFAGFNRDVLRFTAVERAISDGTHKLVRSSLCGDQLFALASDRDELTDVCASEPTLFKELKKKLDDELATLPAYVGPPLRPPEDPDEGAVGRGLNNLGYVDGGERGGGR